MKMEDKERNDYEKFKMDRHHEASIYESTYVIGKLEGIEEGIEQGAKEKAVEIAKSLLDILDVEMIALKTGLSEEKIIGLR